MTMDAASLSDDVRALLDGRNFGTVATVNPDGGPQSSVVWIDREGDQVLFSATRQRQKVRNLARDSRVSVAVYDRENPYHSAEIRGRAEIEPDPDNSLGNRLSQKYLGEDAPDDPPGTERVLVRVTPIAVNEFSV
jgi:PPOX class probable F420-dependent enzyme